VQAPKVEGVGSSVLEPGRPQADMSARRDGESGHSRYNAASEPADPVEASVRAAVHRPRYGRGVPCTPASLKDVGPRTLFPPKKSEKLATHPLTGRDDAGDHWGSMWQIARLGLFRESHNLGPPQVAGQDSSGLKFEDLPSVCRLHGGQNPHPTIA